MLQKFASAVVRGRRPILIALCVLALLCAGTISKCTINYDFTQYLNEKTMTRRGLDIMNREFTSSEQMRVMLTDGDAEQAAAILNALDCVSYASVDGEREQNGHIYTLITLTMGDGDGNAALAAIEEALTGCGTWSISGSAVNSNRIMQSLAEEIPLALGISVLIVLLVLLLTSDAWAEPLVFFPVIVIGILINMGTNWIFPSISFVTFAVCAILQLALSMDYAIMLLHSYNALLGSGMTEEQAMREALAGSFMPISASALTTMAGLLSLLFMSFTIGFDIGIVLSKGILCSVLSVFLAMPGIALGLRKPLHRTRHKPIRLGGGKIAGFAYRFRRQVAPVLLVLVLLCAYLQTTNTYTFTQQDEQREEITTGDVFGADNMLVVLIPSDTSDEGYAVQRALADELSALAGVDSVASMVTTGAQALEYYGSTQIAEMLHMNQILVRTFLMTNRLDPSGVRADQLLRTAAKLLPDNETVASLTEQIELLESSFIGPEHMRLLLKLNVPMAGEETWQLLEEIGSITARYYSGDYALTGDSMSSYDIGHAFQSDLLLVNGLTIAAILLILLFSFRSFCVPVMLVCVIQGAIWITMGISAVTSQPVFFISYLICVAIQMGATIDYGILLTDNYQKARMETADRRQALVTAMEQTLPTVATSGIILIAAGYTVGRLCSVYYIYSIGLLLSRGALISVLMILLLLPMLLVLLDCFVVRRKGKAAA